MLLFVFPLLPIFFKRQYGLLGGGKAKLAVSIQCHEVAKSLQIRSEKANREYSLWL
ncbi:MAG TPA: hypothetical protein VF629_05520 [Hymenobacter sp.]|jgi:hypothetical protein|uniref:hypothetical protein n=1 Tax=Hymenobacter sp. TaxID=1898978 RepID=UPI002ED971CA